MRLNQIRDFVAVADCGSIRAAARRIGVSQPALTKSIRQLEAELDALLMERSSLGVSLTASGRAFLARARTVLAELRKAREDLSDLSGGRGGSVAVGIASVVASVLVPEALFRYRQRRADGRVRVIEGTQETLFPMVRDGTLDLAACLRLESEPMGGLQYRPLLRTRLVVACRSGHPLRHARSLTELQDAEWLTYRPPGGGGALEEAFALEGLRPPRSTVHCESHGIAIAVLQKTDTLGVVARPLLDHPLARGALQQIALQRPLPALTVGLFSRADAAPTAAASAFATALTAAARSLLRSS